MAMSLHPLAYSREADRCAKLARLFAADQDYRAAARHERLASELRAKAGRGVQ